LLAADESTTRTAPRSAWIDRAAAFSRTRKLPEDGYALLRRTAMNENKKIAEVAQSVITAAELFK
jgi:response regulator NasT